jgi:hypothetical protein
LLRELTLGESRWTRTELGDSVQSDIGNITVSLLNPLCPLSTIPVKAKRKPKQTPKRDLLVGTWYNADEYATEVEFTVTRSGDSYAVRVCDCHDGEQADVYETAWDGCVLSFAAHWNSTGRFARYRLLLLSAHRIDVTYAYTDHEMYHRKRTKRNA